jgi:hypothetical protein
MDTLFLICICFILVFLLWITYYGHQRFKQMNQEMQRLKYDISAVHKSLEGISKELQNLMIQRPPAIPSLQHLLQSGAAQVLPEPIHEDTENDEDDDEEEMNRMMEEIMEEEDSNNVSGGDNDSGEDSGEDSSDDLGSDDETEQEEEQEEEEEEEEEEDEEEKETTEENQEEESREGTQEDTQEDEETPEIVVPPTPVRPTRPARGRGRGRGGNARQAIRTIQERIESKLHE